MRSIKVSNAGFIDINGNYTEIKQNVFEMKRSDNNRIYQLSIDASTPFAYNVWSIKRIDGNNEICIYINTNDIFDDNNANWQCIVGSEPFPNIEFNESKQNESKQDDNLQKFINSENNKRKNWKTKCNLLYWSRHKNNWLKGKICEINDGFVCVQSIDGQKRKSFKKKPKGDSEEKDDGKFEEKLGNEEISGKIWIEINSELLQPDIDENYKRKLKKKQNVNVWSRNELKWKNGRIRDIQQDFVYVQCGSETRWIQKNSFLIQSY